MQGCEKKAKKFGRTEEPRKKPKMQKKFLQFAWGSGIIMRYDCDRYALKREVAAQMCRFFRGVCPILNRATDIFERTVFWLMP